MKTRHLLACSALALAVAAPASASTINLVSVTGTWISADPAAVVTGVGTPIIFWGTGSTGPSSYTFLDADTPAGPFDPEEVFDLGTFIHGNNPITPGNSLSTATLEVQWEVAIPTGGDIVSGTSTFVFTHTETPNAASPCADGGEVGIGVNVNGCADLVVFGPGSDLDTSVTVDGIQYFLTLSGFTVGGASVSEFWTVEREDNTAVLAASFTQRELGVVPLPAAGWMLLTALGGLGAAGYRRRKAA